MTDKSIAKDRAKRLAEELRQEVEVVTEDLREQLRQVITAKLQERLLLPGFDTKLQQINDIIESL